MNSDMTGNSTKIDYTTYNNKYGIYKINYENKNSVFGFILGLQTNGYFPNTSYTRKQVHFKMKRSINLD